MSDSDRRPGVLIVDDDEFMRQELRDKFVRAGYDVSVAADGEAALATWRQARQALVVTDLRMPRVSGEELLRRLDDEAGEDAPVVLCVSGAVDVEPDRLYANGACAFFPKPVNPDTLVAASRRLLSLQRRADRGSAIERQLVAAVRETLAARDKPEGLRLDGADDVRRLVATLAHEVRGSLAGVIMNARFLAQLLGADDRAGVAAQRIERHGARLGRVIDALRGLFAEDGTAPRREPVAPREVLQDALAQLESTGALAGVTLHLAIDDALTVAGDRTQLALAVRNLVENAAYAARAHSVLPEVRVTACAEADALVVQIADNGGGVPEDLRDRVFEPRFSTKGEDGTGMGLWVARRVAEAHGGRLELAPTQPAGAVFRIVLPGRPG